METQKKPANRCHQNNVAWVLCSPTPDGQALDIWGRGGNNTFGPFSSTRARMHGHSGRKTKHRTFAPIKPARTPAWPMRTYFHPSPRHWLVRIDEPISWMNTFPLEKKSTYRNSDDPENTGTIYLHGDRSMQ